MHVTPVITTAAFASSVGLITLGLSGCTQSTPTPAPIPNPFYSSGGDEEIHFQTIHGSVAVEVINRIWPNMSVSFTEGTGVATSTSVSDYTRRLLSEETPFGGLRGSVRIPKGSGTDQLDWGEYVAYSRKQVCYIAANIVAGNSADQYASGLGKLIPPLKCDNDLYEAGFKRALIGLLAACSVDPTLANESHGPMLIVAKSTDNLTKAPNLTSQIAKMTSMKDAGLRTCRFRDGSASNPKLSDIPQTPKQACDGDASIDFMREGNALHGQVILDISAAWIGGYILARGGCGGFDGGQDERLMTFMPEIMVLAFFLSQKASPIDPAGVSLLVPAYILGARKIFAGFDGTSRDAGPDFNAGRPTVNAAVPLHSDLLTIKINGDVRQISGASPFLGFQSINQFSGLAKDVPSARKNQNKLQLLVDGEYGFQNQVAAWYNAVSLTSWHADVQAILQSVVTAVGSGPWGSGVWWGSSQVFFLVMWMGQALAKQTWGNALPFDYYIYSSFTENPSNQCLAHNKADCDACLRACDNTGYAGFPPVNQRYCCMEKAPWIPSPGLFDGKPCIPVSSAPLICGVGGLADIYDKYIGRTVAELWSDVEDTLHKIDPSKTTVFDSLLGLSVETTV